MTTHNKLFVVDDATLVGSHNLTGSALDDNTEGSVYVGIPEVTAFYAAYVEALWASPQGVGELVVPSTGPVVPLYDRTVAGALRACLQGEGTGHRIGQARRLCTPDRH